MATPVLPRIKTEEDTYLVLPVLRGEGVTGSLPDSTFGAEVSLGWTEAALLARFEVRDDAIRESDDPDRLYTGDSVELLMGTGRKADGMTQVVVAPSGRTQVLEYRAASLRSVALKPDVRATRIAGGYRVEIALPWSAMGITPVDGGEVSVRVQVNDARDGEATRKWTYAGNLLGHDFFELPPFVLGQTAKLEPEWTVWGGFVELSRARVFVQSSDDRGEVVLRAGGAEVARAKLEAKKGQDVGASGARSGAFSCSFDWLCPPPGQPTPSLSVELAAPRGTDAARAAKNGEGDATGTENLTGAAVELRQVPLEDLAAARTRAFEAGARGPSRWEPAASWMSPRVSGEVFAGTELPRPEYPDSARAEQAFGKIGITTEYFDARYRRVSAAHRPGRYAAVSRIVSDVGEAVAFHTLYRIPGTDPTTLPARPDGKRPTAADLAAAGTDWVAKSERDWWYPLQKSLALAKPYELFVRLPAGYDEHPDRLYPVIVYLHGSGGGDRIASVLIDGPQAYAAKTADSTFIVVSLRSPGGWNPPQVYDTLNALAPTLRHDPAMWYLTGFSMGGMGTWTVATDDPSRWAAIAPVGGRSGDPARAARLKDLPAWVFNGAADGVTTSKDALVAVESLRQAGNPSVKWTEFPNADHVDSLRLAYAMPELYAWFLSNRRP